jgi:hypothetical protein
MGRFNIRILNASHRKEFETGLRNLESAISDLDKWVEKMDPEYEVVVRRRQK